MFKLPYLPAIAWLVIITLLSTSPGVPMPQFNLISMDKLGHAGAYALLAWLMLGGLEKARQRAATKTEAIAIFCIATGYGALMEFVQATFFPYRYFEVDDMLANGIGALAATLGIMLGFPHKKMPD